MAFTCGVCNTRSARKISKRAYHHGVVIVQCPHCSNRHLIADRLGWFGDDTDIVKIMKEKGEVVRMLSQYRLAGVEVPIPSVHAEGIEWPTSEETQEAPVPVPVPDDA